MAVSAMRLPEIADGLKKSLCCRGPDFLGYTTRTILRSGLPDISIHCTSTVLALRGDYITKQPLEDADSGSLLCWNGEAWKFDDQPVEGNDGEGLFARLVAIKEVRLDARRDSVLDVFRLVKGPFALVYFDAMGKCLYYARDRLGRRSLLVHTDGQGETLVLASVTEAAEPDWKEVPADGIYTIDLDEIPEVSGPALSASRHNWTPSEEADLISGIGRFNMDLPHADDMLDSSSSSVAALHAQLRESLKLRTLNVPRPPGSHTDDVRVAILFSGGLDCTVLARLANEVVPADQGIDLINVAFDSHRGQTPTNNEVVAHDVYEQCPDRRTGRRAFAELKRVCPARNWRFIAANITKEEALAHMGRVVSLMFPYNTEMDLSIALALYFASRGIGYGYTTQAEFDSTAPNVTSPARVLLSGLGADELFGGYSRHASAFKLKGYPGLVDELKLDVSRITERNLGRDDRIISSWGKEVRFPYLDEDLFRSVIATPVAKKCDFGNTSHTSGIEPAKRVLRLLADGLGLPSIAREKKRAIQFGSRTAKLVRTGGMDQRIVARAITNVAPARSPSSPGDSEEPFFELLTVGRLLTDIDEDPSNPHPPTISMQASVYSSSSACPQSCSCRCHLSSALCTLSWFQPVLGIVLLNYGCIPLLGAGPCNQANCVRASSRVELTYYFPARVLKRALCFSIEVGGSFGYGTGLHFGVPRVFSSHDEAWEAVNFGGSEDLKSVWAKRPGAYTPLDVNKAGMSLLKDAMARKNTKAAMFLIDAWGLRESKCPCDRSTIMVAREMISLPSGVSSPSELEPLFIIASLSPDGLRTPFSPLHRAIQSGSSISSLLSSSPPPGLNQRDFLGRTPLIHASRINNLPAVQLLLRAGAKLIDARDSLSQTALLAALVGGHIRIALALLNAGCAVRVANEVGRTPLHAIFRTWDSWNPHPDAAEVLARLVQGGDVRARSSYGYTPLHYLVWRARAPVPLVTRVLRMVLDAGADVNTKDEALGAPAVLYAVRARSSAVLRILLERGARLTFVDQSGANILGELATSADLKGLKIVKDARMSGVNIFLANAKQHTPLGKWRERVRRRKLEDTNISIREETAAFELLVRDIRDRQLQEDVDHLGEILRGIKTTNLSQANNSFSQLIQKKTDIRLVQDIEILRTLRIQLKEGMWEAARETVQEVVEICRDRSKRSPWAEDQYHWRELQVSEWVDIAGAGGTT